MALKATVAIRPDQKIGTISPHLYGHFTEHLGHCIYDGIWVGEGSEIPNDGGIRTDTVAALKAVKAPNVRWPGGCFADDYHWEDGVGPREERPRRVNIWWDDEESNQFGTDEFMRFCRMVDTAPYICMNVGSGTVAEQKLWVEYCNWIGDTQLSKLREANGSAEPHAVSWWAVGNENWGCGGRFTPEHYAMEYRRFACYLRGRSKTPLNLVAAGHTTPDWNRRFLTSMGCWDMIDHLSIHRYYHRGHQTDFDEDDYYGLYAEATAVDDDIRATVGALDDIVRGSKFIGIALDEWGVWHREAGWGLEQVNTHRDALVAASVLDILNHWCARVTMANLAQTINVLQCLIHTSGESFWKTPTYHLFDLYQAHMGKTAVVALVDGPSIDTTRGDGREMELALLGASASIGDDATAVALALTNRSLIEPMKVKLDWGGLPRAKSVTARCLTSDHPAAHNTAEQPDYVGLQEIKLTPAKFEKGIELPPMSVTMVELTY